MGKSSANSVECIIALCNCSLSVLISVFLRNDFLLVSFSSFGLPNQNQISAGSTAQSQRSAAQSTRLESSQSPSWLLATTTAFPSYTSPSCVTTTTPPQFSTSTAVPPTPTSPSTTSAPNHNGSNGSCQGQWQRRQRTAFRFALLGLLEQRLQLQDHRVHSA